MGSSADGLLEEGMLLLAGSFPCLEDFASIDCHELAAGSTVAIATFAAIDLETTLVCSISGTGSAG